MPVYNGESYLADAIDSILNQTYTNFEFLIIDDGSSDGSAELIKSYDDHRIQLISLPCNKGLVNALNMGLDLARGEYVARMDADDISMPERLERQILFLDANSDIDVCGSWLEAFDGVETTIWNPPLTDEEIKCSLLFESVIYHPTVMMRKSIFLDGSVRYSRDYPHAEDYELWVRLSRSCRFANIGEVLLKYRLHDRNIGRLESDVQLTSAGKVRRKLFSQLGIKATEEEMELHDAISTGRFASDFVFLQQVLEWFAKLHHACRENRQPPYDKSEKVLAQKWYQTCFISTSIGIDSFRLYYRSDLSSILPMPFIHRLVFLVRSIFKIAVN